MYMQAGTKSVRTRCEYDPVHLMLGFSVRSFVHIHSRPGAVVVNRSIELGQPVIFVSMNYRYVAKLKGRLPYCVVFRLTLILVD